MEAWGPILNTVASAFFGSLVATIIVARLTQKWIEERERRRKRDQLQLELYLDIVDLVLDNELAIAERKSEGQIPPVELQSLKLLGSPTVKKAYSEYTLLVFQETAHPVPHRPMDPDKVVRA